MDTVADEGAVPCVGLMPIQLPLSAVLLVDVHVSVPLPPFRICATCAVGAAPPVLMKKLSCPGRLSKNEALKGATVSVTGTVSDSARLEYWVRMISAV